MLCGRQTQIYLSWFIIPTADRRADSTGRRNTLITEVCGGDERLEQEDERCA